MSDYEHGSVEYDYKFFCFDGEQELKIRILDDTHDPDAKQTYIKMESGQGENKGKILITLSVWSDYRELWIDKDNAWKIVDFINGIYYFWDY